MTEVFINESNGKEFKITVDQQTILTKTGNRSNSKTYPSLEAALKDYNKKKWEKLKKGFVYYQPKANKGKALHHRFLGSGYTGCLSLVAMGEQVAVYRFQDFSKDALAVFDTTYQPSEVIKLPKPLPWQLAYASKYHRLLMDADHYIFQRDLAKGTYQALTKSFDQPASFIALSEDHVFYGAHPKIALWDLETQRDLFSKKIEVELYHGHSSQLAGGISADGSLVAYCTHAGKINILNNKGILQTQLQGDFEMVDAIYFLADHKLLLKEKYGTWGLRLFDWKTGEELASFQQGVIDAVDLHPSLPQALLSVRKKLFLLDLDSFEVLQEIEVEHCIKRCEAVFWGSNRVAVRTDYGCFSVYAL